MGDFLLPFQVPVDDRHVGRYRLNLDLYRGSPIQCASAPKPETTDAKGILRAWDQELARVGQAQPEQQPEKLFSISRNGLYLIALLVFIVIAMTVTSQ